jgi:hypothetical protein
MRNPAVFYGVIAVGVILLAVGLYYFVTAEAQHPFRAFVGLGVGALLLIGGVIGLFSSRSKAVSR